MKHLSDQRPLGVAAAQAGMDEKTARKYRDSGQLPSQGRVPHTWRTRPDPFAAVWAEVAAALAVNPGLQAKTLFDQLQRQYPGRFSDGQLRTLQRRIKVWRATEGPPKEVFFPQVHPPGQLAQSDFTHMGSLSITLAGQPFVHLLYHFVLTYSNWETGMICFSESFESLSAGLQQALWELGGVPQQHQTDRLTAAIPPKSRTDTFTTRYAALLRHYGLEGRLIQAASPHENGDIEQRHHRLKQAVEQALLLRGSRDFADRAAYAAFLRGLFAQLNAGRQERLAQERLRLGPLPAQPLDPSKRLQVKVGPSSTIRVSHNVYSVDSRLIGETLEVHLHAEHLELWYARRRIETMPRLRGESQALIQYRHLIDWLVKKPGAFENYRYRAALFPSSRFRMAYDALRRHHPPRQADREYLSILHLAAHQGEALVEPVLETLVVHTDAFTGATVEAHLAGPAPSRPDPEVAIAPVDLTVYDGLLEVDV
ncbi:MAG: IS21 family transposase [Acidiferrobacteraceae bacterium]|nr:IS21 family transposase [Acidiferrobacteraceae bacterium]